MSTEIDIARRDAVAVYRLVGAPPEPDLEGLVQLAATLCDVSTAVINIIDDRFQYQVAAVGFEAAVCTREDSMCAVVIQQPGHVMVPDARLDPRFVMNPFVTGEIAHVRFYASSPLTTPSGVTIGTLCVFDEETGELAPDRSHALSLLASQVVDVLELRRITSALGESNEQLEHFAGQISHDLRNPLTAISGFLELASDSPEMEHAPQAARALARAESAAARMNRMLGDLLDYARIGGARPSRRELVVEVVAQSVIEDLHGAIVDSGAEVSIQAHARVVGDVSLLRALLQNLVANAIKFAAASGVSPRVVIEAHELPGFTSITVDDNGPGVPVEQRERVFELMERGVAHDVSGLGIGLSTCRRIVQSHGGQISITKSPLGGARLRVVLPNSFDEA